MSVSTTRMIKYVVLGYKKLKVFLKRNDFKLFLKTDQMLSHFLTVTNPRAGGAKRLARVLIPPGYLHPGKRKH
jgi:hypothetical protein